MIAAIFIVPLIYLFNAFFIGRLFKRRKINIDPFLSSLIGFAIFFDIIYIISIWMYASYAPVWSYFLIFGIVQGILLSVYIANWKYAFITWTFNPKKIAFFLIIFVALILIGWLNFRDLNSEFGRMWEDAIKHTQLDIWKPILFSSKKDDLISNFSAFNIANQMWIDVFKIKKLEDAKTFLNWSWTIIASCFLSAIALWIEQKNVNNSRYILCILIFLIFGTLILAFIESFAIGDSWVLILLLFYILLIAKNDISHSFKLLNLTSVLLCFLAASCTSFYVVIALWIFSIYYVIRNKLNSINYFLLLSWPLFLAIFSFVSRFIFWLLPLINALYLVIAIICVGIFLKFGTPTWDTKIATVIFNNSRKIVYGGLILLISIVLITNFFIFQEMYKWDSKNIDYHNFLTFTYTYLWSIKITSLVNITIVNSVMYVLFASLALAYIIIRNMPKHKLNKLLKTNFVIKFGIISCILFINPLVIHVLNVSELNFPLNTLDLNALFVVPIFVIGLQAIFNYKIKTVNNWDFNWY